ncbi:hypothetical protein P8452_21468 [Trifolium repens]|nr:hypothetical protein P8452_21468 [Trifolium repens]
MFLFAGVPSLVGFLLCVFRFGLVKVVVAALVAVFALAVGGVCNQMFFFGVWFVRVCVQRLGFVAEVEDGGSGDGGVWVQIEVEVVGGMLWFGVAGVGVLVADLLCFQLFCISDFYVCLFFAVVMVVLRFGVVGVWFR